jgi:arylformamidase
VILDLSHEITAGLLTYPGLPPPELHTAVSRSETAARLHDGVSFEVEVLTLVGNTGTYLDAPFHYHAGLADIGELPLDRLVNVPIALVNAVGMTSIGTSELSSTGELAGHAVLFHTGWSKHWGGPVYSGPGSPYLTADAVAALIEADVAVVGIDSLNIDNTGDPARPAHQGLLGAGIPIIEHLTNLELVPAQGATLTALPAPVRRMASFPVRAVAVC